MKILSLLAIFAVITCLNSIAFAQDGIRVEIIGVENEDGQVFIGLFNNNDGFPDKGREYKGAFVNAGTGTLRHTFTEIPSGDYAIAIFHDSNTNGRLDKNFLGIPKEGYGFSSNATATFGAPSFGKAKFQFTDTYTAKIIIGY